MFRSQPNQANGANSADILGSYRNRIWSLFAAVCVAVFLPGSIFIFFTGFRTLAAAVLCMLTVLALNHLPGVQTRAPRLMMALFVASLMLVVGLCLLQRGVFGISWTFPAILLINFLAAGRWARIYTLLFMAYITPLMFYSLEAPTAARALAGLIVTVLLINIFLAKIDELQRKLVEQSGIDPLTETLNRRDMDSVLGDAIERKRRSKAPVSLLVFDIDEFKSVNDTYGHAVGDQVLKQLVSIVATRARSLDKLFRLGGDEFMLLLPDTTRDGALTLAEDVCRLVSQTSFVDGRLITVSIGASELEHGETMAEWLKRADDALFAAKGAGRNQVVVSTEADSAACVLPLQEGGLHLGTFS